MRACVVGRGLRAGLVVFLAGVCALTVVLPAGPSWAGGRPGSAAAVVVGWPVDPRPAVLRLFRPPAQRWLAGHRGVDLAAEPGTTVRSPAAGVVTFSGPVAGRPVITVQDGLGRRHSLEPVDRPVAAGTVVRQGEVIGVVGAPSGHCPGWCLHWGVRVGDRYVDPLQLVTRAPPVLLPLRRVTPAG